ncbi:MAG TPA: glycosyltransferase, partial [Parachlamydiaceae bacterium]|nr:glycosyltransferase [Parachlamydiaceae bacterium]
YFTEKLAEAMERHGIKTKIIDVRQESLGTASMNEIREFAPDFTCSFNSFEPIKDGLYLWDFLKIPHLSFLVDPPFYSTTLINSPYSMLSCVDRSDCEAVRSNGFERVFFWPHAVEKELSADKNEKRIYDVVLLGSCYDYESLRLAWQQRNPITLNKVLDDAIDIVFSNEQVSLAQALVMAWQASQLDPQGIDFYTLYYYLDNYTRGKDRVELVKSIKNAHVHVFGELATDNAVGILSWKQYLGQQPNVTVHPPTLFGEGMQVLKQSKIVLNSMPFFRDGSHERIFTGLACGCLPITSESKYLREQFTDGKDLLFYHSNKRDEVNGMIDGLLSNEKKRQEMAAKGREIVMKHHTWDQRVEELKKIVPAMLKA